MNKFLTPAFVSLATPALAADGPFFDLKNTDFIVLCGFLVFVGILFYFNIPSMLMGMLDKRGKRTGSFKSPPSSFVISMYLH